MELTIEQALQQGVTAHKEGKLEDAERLYRAILQSQPAHPDANHNLGVLAVSVNKAGAALPLFKTALEANPKIEQFWLSYIDALIKEKQFDNAKKLLEQAKKQGVARDKVDAIEAQITTTTQVNEPKSSVQKKSLKFLEKRKKLAEQKKQKKAKNQNLKAISPSDAEIKSLLAHYQNGRYDEAEKLAVKITQEFPEHQFGWKVLGVVLKQTGRIIESLVPSQKAATLSSQDAEAHSNLGNTLQELGRLDEAEASYTQAIALKPDYAAAHSNLGNTLQKLGRLDEAEASYRQAIGLKPDYAEAHCNLGNTLKELGRLEETEASYMQAILLKPDYAEAHYNLGVTLQELGRLEEAEASYTQAISLKPDFAEAHYNLGNTLGKLGRLEEAEASLRQAIALKPDFAKAHSYLGVTLKELGRLDEAEASYTQAIALKPDFAEAHSNLGHMLRERSKYEEAIHHYDLVNTDDAMAQSLECLYTGKNYTEFDKRLYSLSASGNMNLRVAAVSSFAAHQMKKKDPYPFCTNPLDFISINNLAEYNFYSDTFLDKIIKEADGYQLTWESRTTKFGFQGPSNVFENPSKTISHLECIVQQAVDAYYDTFKFESNLFIKYWPRKYKLVGWYNRLVMNGYHTSHIHPRGWLSGVIYLKTTDLSNNDEGAIEFGLHGYDLPITDEDYPRKLHRPKRGDIVLFPSSLFHRTIPFTMDSERCVIAFDITAV
jgi:tetratricopeptide (TPR) repeat protein